jgi:tRNA (guanine10-N2)-dimethyltransferase
VIRAGAALPTDEVVVQVTGDHPELARAELDAVLDVVGGTTAREWGALTYRCKVPRGGADEVARRGGLLRYVGLQLATARGADALDTSALEVKGTYAVRATAVGGATVDTMAVERAVGKRVRGGRVNLDRPAHVFRVFVGPDEAVLTHQRYDRIDDDIEDRQVRHRPFFKPVSLHPKFARVLVNLSRVHDGQELLDPFCGTGGILIEAGLVGARPIGIDAQAEEVEGAARNLEHFGVLGARILHGRAKDARALVGHPVAAIATDPPYGRSATTLREGPVGAVAGSVQGLCDALLPGGRLAICMPEGDMGKLFEDVLDRELCIAQRVHGSLTRHYFVFRKQGGPARGG